MSGHYLFQGHTLCEVRTETVRRIATNLVRLFFADEQHRIDAMMTWIKSTSTNAVESTADLESKASAKKDPNTAHPTRAQSAAVVPLSQSSEIEFEVYKAEGGGGGDGFGPEIVEPFVG